MRKICLCLCLCLLLSGCGSMKKNDFLSVSEHREQPVEVQRPTEETILVSNRGDLRWRVLYFCRNWIEQGEIWIQDYEGDVSADLDEILSYATQKDPFGAYAVDYMDAEFTGDASQGRITLSIVFRRPAAELAAIPTVYGNEAALEKIYAAIQNCDPGLTLYIRNYFDTDFAAQLRLHCIENPTTFAAIPAITAKAYPDEGQMRILELHFAYPESKEVLLERLEPIRTTLDSAAVYVQTGKTDADRVKLLSRFLTERVQYVSEETEPSMPAYSLLSEKTAHSLSFASVFYAECRMVQLPCYFVQGERNGKSHYWNLVEIDGSYYHVDLMRNLAQEGNELLYDEDLLAEGYLWDSTQYPAAPRPPVPDETSSPE